MTDESLDAWSRAPSADPTHALLQRLVPRIAGALDRCANSLHRLADVEESRLVAELGEIITTTEKAVMVVQNGQTWEPAPVAPGTVFVRPETRAERLLLATKLELQARKLREIEGPT